MPDRTPEYTIVHFAAGSERRIEPDETVAIVDGVLTIETTIDRCHYAPEQWTKVVEVLET